MKQKLQLYAQFFLSLIGFWYPLILTVITLRYYGGGEKAILEYALVFVFIISINLLLRNKHLYTFSVFLSSLIFSGLAFFDIAHFAIFKHKITASTIYIIMETNAYEVSEFLSTYLSPQLLILFITLMLSVMVGSLLSFTKYNYVVSFKKLLVSKKYYIAVGIVLSTFTFGKYLAYFTPYIAINSAIEFREERKKISNIEITENGLFTEVSHTSASDKETYVLIIGESTTRNHMGIYGYYRQTTPLLKARENELLVYKNVRSPNAYTISALRKALTLEYHKNLEYKLNTTLIQLFNNVGFHTYFISNQRPIGKYETTTELITRSAQKRIFTNVAKISYDENVLEHLRTVLSEKMDKKFIMIHLMGTHSEYCKRYPPEYSKFKDIPKTPFKHAEAYQTINEYDNAVLYNDYIVNSIIDEVKNEHSKAYVLYFSDHGDDVFETMNDFGHLDSKGTDPMYQVPFIIWLSEQYKNENLRFAWDVTRKYNHRHLIHTVADLSNINFGKFDASKSVVSPSFAE